MAPSSHFPHFELQFHDNKHGTPADAGFITQGIWLQNSEVRHYVFQRRGRWHVVMVFIAVSNPFQFLCREINHYESEQKACNAAQILQRGAAKDARGTLKSNTNAFHICSN
ncbi:MAG: hypothetical protein MUF71_17270 [Candidatus Kapabacteria bacterium]|jgi:hypothetical protein|nr:hypothetical protein [Candidatus Kapabacteria bacterium]